VLALLTGLGCACVSYGVVAVCGATGYGLVTGCGLVTGRGLVTGCGLVHLGGRLMTGGGLVAGGVRKRVTGCGLVHPGGRLVTGGGLVTGGVRKRVTGRGLVPYCRSSCGASCVKCCERAFTLLQDDRITVSAQGLGRRNLGRHLHNMCKSQHQN